MLDLHIASFVIFLALTTPASPPAPAAKSDITAVQYDVLQAYVGRDPDKLAAAFADNGIAVSKSGELFAGKARIAAYYQGLFGSSQAVLVLSPRELRTMGSTASESGDYTYRDADSGMLTGAYVTTYQLTNGEWKVSSTVLRPPAITTPPISAGVDFWLRFATGGLTAIVALFAALIGYLAGIRSWRLKYFTEQWWATMRFLYENSQFLDGKKNKDYMANYPGEELRKYELVARMSIGLLDDMYCAGSKKDLENWFRGSIKVLAAPHQAWFRTHQDSYDPKFYTYLSERLPPADPEKTKGVHA